jgi:hypothetical protein
MPERAGFWLRSQDAPRSASHRTAVRRVRAPTWLCAPDPTWRNCK